MTAFSPFSTVAFRLVTALIGLGCGSVSPAQSVPTGFQVDTLVQSGLPAPIDLAFVPDGRVLIANRMGELTVYNGSAAVQIGVVPFVLFGSERGLLSIDVDPLFPQNGYVYVFYTSNADAFLHVDRFTLVGDLNNPTSTNLALDLQSRRVVIDSIPDADEHHNGGSLRFGPDGMLYLGIGDDNTNCDAQSPSSGRGCLLRMDISQLPAGGGLVAPGLALLNPGNNPLSASNDLSQLVVAHGLRNPFRMEIDGLTGNVYIGDVGAGSAEEVNEYAYGAGVLPLRNYGWPWYEGTSTFTHWCQGNAPVAPEQPIAVGDHAVGWGVLIQGPRYRNQGGPYDFGPAYEGTVFCLDYYLAWLQRYESGPGGWVLSPPVPGQPNATNWGDSFSRVTAMRQGPDGAIYYTQDVPWWTGVLGRIRPSVSANQILAHSGADQVAASGDPFAQPLTVRVQDGSGSPQVGVPVDFSIFGPATLSTSGPVLTDGQGFARVFVTAGATGGTVSVTATAQGVPGEAMFSLFTRKLSVAHTSSLAVITIRNLTDALPAQVPFIVMLALPGAPPWNAPFGPVCTDPASPLTIVIEDALGIFGGFSLSGAGSTGAPGLTRVYSVPQGLLTGLQLNFQAIGVDPVEGWFRTDCVNVQF